MEEIHMPLIAGKQDLKQLILGVLLHEQPLSAKQVYNKIDEGNNGRSFTYQGVHKALNHLVESNVLQHAAGKYVINHAWVSKLSRLSEDLEFVSLKQRPASIIEMPPYSTITIKCEGMLVEPYYWSLEQEYKWWEAFGSPVNTVLLQRRVWPLPLGESEWIKFHKVFVDKEQYVLSSWDSKVDRALLGAWDKLKWKCAMGVPCAKECEVICFAEFVLQVFHPPETKRKWDKIYKEIEEDTSFPLYRANEVGFKIITPSTWVVTRNKDYAQKILAEAKSNYEHKRKEAANLGE